jgi:hypothetical protein
MNLNKTLVNTKLYEQTISVMSPLPVLQTAEQRYAFFLYKFIYQTTEHNSRTLPGQTDARKGADDTAI